MRVKGDGRMRIVGYSGDRTPAAFAKVVGHAVMHCRYFVLVVAKGRQADAMRVLDGLMPFLVMRRMVTVWPGTVHLGGEAREMLKFELNHATVEIIVGEVLPELLQEAPSVEDISFLREDGRPWFISITHEHDAFFKLEPEELDALVAVLGRKSLTEEGDDEAPDERY